MNPYNKLVLLPFTFIALWERDTMKILQQFGALDLCVCSCLMPWNFHSENMWSVEKFIGPHHALWQTLINTLNWDREKERINNVDELTRCRRSFLLFIFVKKCFHHMVFFFFIFPRFQHFSNKKTKTKMVFRSLLKLDS